MTEAKPATAEDSKPMVHTETDCACGSDHDHGPTGADVVKKLASGFAILSLVIPVFAILLLVIAAFATPSSPAVLLMGVSLGVLHLGILFGLGVAAKSQPSMQASSPTFLVARVGLEEVTRLAVVLGALVLFPTDNKTALGLWVGAGAMLIWAVVTTVQNVRSRQKIVKPSEWSKRTVLSLLNEGISVRRALSLRFLDIAALLLFTLAATALVANAPVMAVATAVLSMATGLSTLIVSRMNAQRRQNTLWVFAPITIALVLCVLVAALAITALT